MKPKHIVGIFIVFLLWLYATGTLSIWVAMTQWDEPDGGWGANVREGYPGTALLAAAFLTVSVCAAVVAVAMGLVGTCVWLVVALIQAFTHERWVRRMAKVEKEEAPRKLRRFASPSESGAVDSRLGWVFATLIGCFMMGFAFKNYTPVAHTPPRVTSIELHADDVITVGQFAASVVVLGSQTPGFVAVLIATYGGAAIMEGGR